MLRQAWAEVRRHPGRFLSTIIAVAISVAFLAGSAVLVDTEGQAQGRQRTLPIAQADVVVTELTGATAAGVLAGVPTVATVQQVWDLQVPLTHGKRSELVRLVGVPGPALRWVEISQGRWAAAPDEVVLGASTASALGVEMGGRIRLAGTDTEFSVVGLTDEPGGAGARSGYLVPEAFPALGVDEAGTGTWALLNQQGSTSEQTAAAVRSALSQAGLAGTVETADAARTASITAMTGSFAAFTYLLWGFAAVALVVGMITIANTFSITLAQRRRQIGLLRAVGASGAQVRRRFLAEALLLGILGSLLGLGLGFGLAAAVTVFTGSLSWGLAVPLGQVGIAVGLGVVATVVAAFVPVLKGTRVHPLEALQPLVSSQVRRQGWVRAVVCTVFVAAGAAVVPLSLSGESVGFAFAILAGALIAAGVLFGAPLYVPALLRLTGLALRRGGPVAELAVKNSVRNPARAAATATALMLAVGLILTMQVATASLRTSMVDNIQQTNPVDIGVTRLDQGGDPVVIPPATREALTRVPGVTTSVVLPMARLQMATRGAVVGYGYDAGILAVTGVTMAPAENQVWASPSEATRLPDRVKVSGARGSATLEVMGSELVEYGQVMVSPATLERLAAPVQGAAIWLAVPDQDQALSVLVAASEIVGGDGEVSGAVAYAAMLTDLMNLLLTITTALLGVAVAIALLGVGNTLGLSALERTREFALLRALGLQSRSLRTMMAIEALQLTVVGVLVGTLAGCFFGWLAVASVTASIPGTATIFTIDLPITLGMIGVAFAAGLAASILPGRRAATAAPTQALAEL